MLKTHCRHKFDTWRVSCCCLIWSGSRAGLSWLSKVPPTSCSWVLTSSRPLQKSSDTSRVFSSAELRSSVAFFTELYIWDKLAIFSFSAETAKILIIWLLCLWWELLMKLRHQTLSSIYVRHYQQISLDTYLRLLYPHVIVSYEIWEVDRKILGVHKNRQTIWGEIKWPEPQAISTGLEDSLRQCIL